MFRDVFMKKIMMAILGISLLSLVGCVTDTGYTTAHHNHIHSGYRDLNSDGLSGVSYSLGYGRLGYVLNDYGFGGYDGGYYSREWVGRGYR